MCECAIGGSDVCHPLGYGLASGRTPSAMNVLLRKGMASVTLPVRSFCRRWTGAEMRLHNRLLQLGLSEYCECCFKITNSSNQQKHTSYLLHKITSFYNKMSPTYFGFLLLSHHQGPIS
jgi:hypothetical protein